MSLLYLRIDGYGAGRSSGSRVLGSFALSIAHVCGASRYPCLRVERRFQEESAVNANVGPHIQEHVIAPVGQFGLPPTSFHCDRVNGTPRRRDVRAAGECPSREDQEGELHRHWHTPSRRGGRLPLLPGRDRHRPVIMMPRALTC